MATTGGSISINITPKQGQQLSTIRPSSTQIQQPPAPSPIPAPPATISDIPPATHTKENNPRPPPVQHPAPEPPAIHIPSYSRWFSWNDIHECETRFLPEFFDGRSPSKSPRVYRYIRNSIIRRFREQPIPHPTRKISFTEARKTIVGDVGSVRRVFDFLDAWGLINYFGSSKPNLKWDDNNNKDTTSAKSNAAAAAAQTNDHTAANTSADFTTVPKRRFCSECKTLCTIACFASDKHDLTLCARCYVGNKYRVGVNSTDFRRVEISDEMKTDWSWTDKETLHLLEALEHYGDDWKKVAEHVGGRSEKECVTRFINLPFGEQFVGPLDSADADDKLFQTNDADSESGFSPAKRLCLDPLADASNPIMAQAAFLSALVGTDVAEAAASAALKALSEGSSRTSNVSVGCFDGGAAQQESDSKSNGKPNPNTMEGASAEAHLQLEKEEQDLERAISDLAQVQTKEIQDKIIHFEEFELQMERERQQLQQIKNMLFVDQLTLLFHKAAAPKSGDRMDETVKIDR